MSDLSRTRKRLRTTLWLILAVAVVAGFAMLVAMRSPFASLFGALLVSALVIAYLARLLRHRGRASDPILTASAHVQSIYLGTSEHNAPPKRPTSDPDTVQLPPE